MWNIVLHPSSSTSHGYPLIMKGTFLYCGCLSHLRSKAMEAVDHELKPPNPRATVTLSSLEISQGLTTPLKRRTQHGTRASATHKCPPAAGAAPSCPQPRPSPASECQHLSPWLSEQAHCRAAVRGVGLPCLVQHISSSQELLRSDWSLIIEYSSYLEAKESMWSAHIQTFPGRIWKNPWFLYPNPIWKLALTVFYMWS